MWEVDYIKKAEVWRIDAFELWCWRRLFRVPWRARRSNQSILKEINPEYSLEGLMLKLKLQYFGHAKKWLIGKDPDAGKDWGQEKKGMTENKMVGWHHWLNGHGFGWTLGVGDGQGGLACCTSWGHKESDRTERLNWTELNWTELNLVLEYLKSLALISLVLSTIKTSISHYILSWLLDHLSPAPSSSGLIYNFIG